MWWRWWRRRWWWWWWSQWWCSWWMSMNDMWMICDDSDSGNSSDLSLCDDHRGSLWHNASSSECSESNWLWQRLWRFGGPGAVQEIGWCGIQTQIFARLCFTCGQFEGAVKYAEHTWKDGFSGLWTVDKLRKCKFAVSESVCPSMAMAPIFTWQWFVHKFGPVWVKPFKSCANSLRNFCPEKALSQKCLPLWRNLQNWHFSMSLAALHKFSV